MQKLPTLQLLVGLGQLGYIHSGFGFAGAKLTHIHFSDTYVDMCTSPQINADCVVFTVMMHIFTSLYLLSLVPCIKFWPW